MLAGMAPRGRQARPAVRGLTDGGTLRGMEAWELDDLETERLAGGRLYHEFLSVPDLSGGLYVLEAGATDPQSPHTEDELYIVMSGRANVTVAGEVGSVVAGSVVFVGAHVEHRFHDITERLVLLVVFGPAEYSRQGH
jgi:mannose-6-phosphate isomerase-like protein (cupin superfamily)